MSQILPEPEIQQQIIPPNNTTPPEQDVSQEVDPETAWLNAQAQAQQVANPPHATTVQVDVAGDSSVLGTVKDTLFGLASGPAKATDEVLDLSWGVGNYVREGVQSGFDKASFREPTEEERTKLFRFHTIEPTTQVGKAAQGLSQSLTGFVAAGYALKSLKVLQGGSTASMTARPILQGALGDFATLDANEERISNIAEKYPSTRGPISAFYAANPDDGMLEGRGKAAGEGALLGVGFDVIASGMKWLGKELLKKGFPPDEIVDTVKSTALIKEWRKNNTIDGGTTAFDTVEKAAKEVFDDEGNITSSLSTVPPPAPNNKGSKTKPHEDLLPSQQIKQIVDKAADAKEAITEVSYNINLNKMVFQSPQGSHVLKQINDALADKTLKAAGPEHQGLILRDSLSDLQEHGIDYSPILAEAGSDPKALHAITRRVLSNRNILHTMTTESSRLSSIINEGRASLVEQAQFVMLSKNIQEMHLSLADTRTELGRALSSLNVIADGKMVKDAVGEGDTFLEKWFGSEGLTNDTAAHWLSKEGWTPDSLKQLAHDIQLMDGNSAAINNALKNSKSGSLWGMITEMRINGLLSGPQTWAANGLGNALKTVVMPSEKIIGGLLTLDKQVIRAGAQTYVGMFKYLSESWGMMGKAFKVGENILDSKNGIMEVPSHQVSYDNIRSLMLKKNPEGELSTMQELLARGMGGFGVALRLPTRIMVATDELFKQMNFRASMYSNLYGEAIDKEGLRGSQDIAEYIETNMRKAFTSEGAVAKGELTADSLLYAQRGTWTQALEEGTLGNYVQTGAAKHPLIRVLVPFVKTPTNIIRDFAQHTLAAPLYKEVREAYAKGGEERARVLGQVAMGQITAMTGILLAYSGCITGSPPKEAKARQALDATGWEPYSIKVGDKYLSYRRIDPVGMFLGQAADVVAVLTGKDDLSELEQNEVVLGLMASVVNNITSKTYMQGISETINALQNPERYGESYIGRMAATFVPASSLLRTLRKEADPHMREMGSVPDYIMNTLPGASDNLPARRHWVTGNIVDYRLIGQDKNDLVLDELQHLGRSVTGAPLKTMEGVKLTTKQYSRLNELHGTVKIQGLTLHQALENLFSSPAYDYKREKLGDAPDGLESPRSRLVDKIIHEYRKTAEKTLLREDAVLLQAVNIKYRERKLAVKGAITKDNQQGLLQRLTQ